MDDDTAIKILEKFNLMLKTNGFIIINVMEYTNGNKEIYEKEPLNPKYNTYFNTYSKDFLLNGLRIINILS